MRPIDKKQLSSLLLGVMFSFWLNAEEIPLYKLDTFTVRAERESLFDEPETALNTTLSAEDFTVLEPDDTVEMLRYFPNVNINQPSISSDEALISVRDQSALANGRLWVLVDGFPVSNLLNSGARGAPRLNLVDPQTIDSVELLYGRYSPAYGGYALGGVIHYKTRPVEGRRGQIGARSSWHDFTLYGTDEVYKGYRGNFRVSENIGDLGIALSGNYFEERSNPQRFFNTTNFESTPEAEPTMAPPPPPPAMAPPMGPPPSGPAPPAPPPTGPTPPQTQEVTGGFVDLDPQGNERIVYGSQGTRETTVGNVSLNLSYDLWEQALLRWTTRYAQREMEADSPETYLVDASGAPVNSGRVDLDGRVFNINPGASDGVIRKESELLNGIGLSGTTDSDWNYALNFSRFDFLERELERTNGRRETSPVAYWLNGKAAAATDYLFNSDKVGGFIGYEWNRSKFEDAVFNADATLDSRNGGQTDLHSVFGGIEWRFAEEWRFVGGLRGEHWASDSGFAIDSDEALFAFEDRSEDALSPSLTIEYELSDRDRLRFNLARATRFPLALELFQNREDETTGEIVLSNPDLAPETSLSAELSWQHNLEKGRLRLTLFRNEVKDAILSQPFDPTPQPMGAPAMGPPPGPPPPGGRSFDNIDRVETWGIEAFYLRRDFFIPRLEASIGTGWMHSKIKRYKNDPDNEGNRYPGVPEWRANGSLRYRFNPSLDLALGGRYQSHIFERIDNTDTRNTLEAVGQRLIFDLGLTWRLKNGLSFNFRVDNLFDEVAFTNRPERQRSISLGADWRF